MPDPIPVPDFVVIYPSQHEVLRGLTLAAAMDFVGRELFDFPYLWSATHDCGAKIIFASKTRPEHEHSVSCDPTCGRNPHYICLN